MKLRKFRITMFKCVIDSGWIDVDDLTVLVGKNEAGKTSLLKALYKLNPFDEDPYSIPREWPRSHRGSRTESQVVCRAEFELNAEEQLELTQMTVGEPAIERVTVAKDYSGTLSIEGLDTAFPNQVHPDDIEAHFKVLPEVPEDVHPEFNQVATDYKAEAIAAARDHRFKDLEAMIPVHEQALVKRSLEQPQLNNEVNFKRQYISQLKQLVSQLKQAPTIADKASEYLEEALPTFVFMDEYRTFRGTAYLDQVQQRKEQNQLTEDDKTLLVIMNLAGLELESEVKKASTEDREERIYDLRDAASVLNKKIQDHWNQREGTVEFIADGHHFMTLIKDSKGPVPIRLEEQSRGFQWFLSFDLMLMHDTRGTFKDCVILLDEPGLHLHPSAQTDLLRRLEEHAADNTLIYTTHLPFLIDLKHPERIRVIADSNDGTSVTDHLTDTQPESKLVLQTALGIKGSTSYLVSDRNLVVEGVDDYWVLNELSNFFVRIGKLGLPPDVLITPSGGASEVTYIATFMVGQDLEVVALYDTDTSGTTAKDKLVKNWLTRYKDRKATALSLGEAAGSANAEFSIEDLFPEAMYLECVKEAYDKQLNAAGVTLDKLPVLPQLVKRVETVFDSASIKFNKGSVCKKLLKKIRSMKQENDLPGDVIAAVDKVFRAIETAFEKPAG